MFGDKPDFLLFVGSAGSYGNHQIFDIVESKNSSNIEMSFLENFSYTPIDNAVRIDTNLTKSEVVVNSSNYISTNQTLSKEFLQYKKYVLRCLSSLCVNCEDYELFDLLMIELKNNEDEENNVLPSRDEIEEELY